MKNIIKLLTICIVMSACNDDFLERYPLSEVSPENSFRNASDLELYTNSFYNDLPGFDGTIGLDRISDNILYNNVPFEQYGARVIPGPAGSSGWSWGDLRKINIFFKYYEQCDDAAARKEYSGVAHFFRAYFYYGKLKRFGDVPWYDQVLGTSDTDLLLKPRDSRIFITDKIIEDLDKAIDNLNTKKSSDRINRWTALALKSRVCLFEGTFRKYHNLSGADALLTLAYQAAQRVIDEGPYSIYTTGSPNSDYRNLFSADDANADEIILTRRYNATLNVRNNINYYFLSPGSERTGLTKSIVDTYLMNTGSAYTSEANYKNKTFLEETANRDPRLSQTIRIPGYTRIGSSIALPPDFTACISGYQITKFVTDSGNNQDLVNSSYGDIPIFRYAEVLLNFAEAKAELGILTQSDIDKSVKLIRDRVGMPNLNLATINANPDSVLSASHPNVAGTNTGIILEIRRERRVELVMEGFRYDDLMRWKNGKLLSEKFTGIYFPSLGYFDMDGNGSLDVQLYSGAAPTNGPTQKVEIGGAITLSNGSNGYLLPYASVNKFFEENRDYLYPIPNGDRLLNPNLEQNPFWE
jgi:hypothetical protein